MIRRALFSSCRAEEWAAAVHRKDLLGRAHYKGFVICSDHFDKREYNFPDGKCKGSSLRFDAVPGRSKDVGHEEGEVDDI